MVNMLESRVLSKEDLEFYFKSNLEKPKWGYNTSEIVLSCDTALQLKEKGYGAVTAIKNAGVPYAKIFEMMGYSYSEIDFSHREREMKEPEMNAGQLQKLIGKKVILTEDDFITGITLEKVRQYLKDREINVSGAYTGMQDWEVRESYFGPYEGFWEIEKNGLRRVNPQRLLFVFDRQRKFPLPKDFEIYTSTEPARMNEAIKRVSEYLNTTRKI